MRNLVIDSGISVKWFVQESDSDTAQLILDEYESDNISFPAPNLNLRGIRQHYLEETNFPRT
jgi:predicted nucleic acid-binding protein